MKLVVLRRRRRRASPASTCWSSLGAAAREHLAWPTRKGVVYAGPQGGRWTTTRRATRSDTAARTLAEIDRRRRHVPRLFAPAACSSRRWSRPMAAKPLILALANPEPEILPGTRQGRAPDCDHRHRPLGLSRTRSTTSCASRSSSAARSTCGATTINEAMKLACGARDRRPGQGRAVRRSSPRPTAGEDAEVRSRLPDSQAVRSAADRATSRRRSPRRRWTRASPRGRSRTSTPTASG